MGEKQPLWNPMSSNSHKNLTRNEAQAAKQRQSCQSPSAGSIPPQHFHPTSSTIKHHLMCKLIIAHSEAFVPINHLIPTLTQLCALLHESFVWFPTAQNEKGEISKWQTATVYLTVFFFSYYYFVGNSVWHNIATIYFLRGRTDDRNV